MSGADTRDAARRIVAATACPAPALPPFPRGGEGQTGTGG